MPTLSLDIVYRTLTTFGEHDLISRVQTTESHARFEAEMAEHHHAIRTRCQIKYKQITLLGICAECAQKKKTGR